MGSLADGLPSRFPIGTRYVVEGRGGEEGRLRIRLRDLEFPDGRHLELPADQANRRARVAGAFPGEARLENNFRRRNRGEARALNA